MFGLGSVELVQALPQVTVERQSFLHDVVFGEGRPDPRKICPDVFPQRCVERLRIGHGRLGSSRIVDCGELAPRPADELFDVDDEAVVQTVVRRL